MSNHPRWEKSEALSSDWNYVERGTNYPFSALTAFHGYVRQKDDDFYAFHKRDFLVFDKYGPFDTLEEAQRLVELLARMEPTKG